MKKRWTAQEAEALLLEQATSGLSKKDFCTARGINSATFYYWQSRQQSKVEEETAVGFHALSLGAYKTIEVQLRSGHWLRLRSTDEWELAQILKALSDA